MKYKTSIEALYVNISLNDAESVNDDDDIQMLEMTVLPPSYTSTPTNTCITELFAALNTCADLHPDPDDSDADDEDLLDHRGEHGRIYRREWQLCWPGHW
jgi:nucleotide-sensitive chloride channel 1A